MNSRPLIAAVLASIFILCGCERQKILNRQQLAEIITARTLGLAYLEENLLKEAEAEFRKVLVMAPQEALGYANLGLVFLRKGQYPEAETQDQKSVV